MEAIAKILSGFRKIHNMKDNRSDYIYYKIIDLAQEQQLYLLQCINTKAVFHVALTDIVLDIDILSALHPTQACYIGIEYSKHIKTSTSLPAISKKQTEKLCSQPCSRYGRYRLCSQSRKNTVCFIDKKNNKRFVTDPRDIALSEELIQEFDAIQAFHIGMLAGLKINKPTEKGSGNAHKHPHLRLVK